MPDPVTSAPRDQPPDPPAGPTPPVDRPVPYDHAGRYDANIQLILRRLADRDRDRERNRAHKPKWWWQSH
jgi:hypothetical protein